MMNDQNDMNTLRAAKAALRRRMRTASRDDQERIVQAIGLLDLLSEGAEEVTDLQSAPLGETQPVTPLPAHPSTNGDIPAGMTFVEAAIEVLKKNNKVPMEVSGLIVAMESRGYEVTAEYARSALLAALKRRSLSDQDVVPVGRNAWGLSEWFTEKRLASLRHAELTRQAMARRKSRGTRFGASLKLSESDATEFKRMIEDGRPRKHIAKHFRMSYASVSNYVQRLRNWKPGDPYPPLAAEPPTMQPQPNLRVVS